MRGAVLPAQRRHPGAASGTVAPPASAPRTSPGDARRGLDRHRTPGATPPQGSDALSGDTTDSSRDTISRITDAIVEDLVAWQNRPLDRPVFTPC